VQFQDPDAECGRYTCTGSGTCYVGCDGVCGGGKCKSNSYCLAGSCNADLPVGVPCIDGCMCQSGSCGAPVFGCLP
jgi:hypothetical protein